MRWKETSRSQAQSSDLYFKSKVGNFSKMIQSSGKKAGQKTASPHGEWGEGRETSDGVAAAD